MHYDKRLKRKRREGGKNENCSRISGISSVPLSGCHNEMGDFQTRHLFSIFSSLSTTPSISHYNLSTEEREREKKSTFKSSASAFASGRFILFFLYIIIIQICSTQASLSV